jgi:L-asparaginase
VGAQVRRAQVLIVSLGGTIASTSTPSVGGVVPQLSALDLVAAVPALDDVANVDAVSFRQVPSGDLDFADLIALAQLIETNVTSGVDGVVVTQGTDTIEETSFALDVLLDVAVPVVVTGAMRNPTLASPDGPGNLLAAVRVAAAATARGLGCLVVMNDEVHAARFVRKTHSSSLATFQSPSAGPLGWVSEERVRIVLRCAPLAGIPVTKSDVVAPVALVTCALGDDGRTLGGLLDLGYRGVVIDAFGGGHVPSAMVRAIEELASTMPVVLCSRTGGGEVLSHTYGFSGSESDLLSRGVTSGGALDGRKARVALCLALAASRGPRDAMAAFARVRDSLSRD